MPDVAIPAELRRDRIVTLVRDREFVRVADLSTMFGISEVTVRSDLDLLAQRGALQRVHGGAVVRGLERRGEPSYEEALGTLADEKAAVGRAAAAMVEPGETLILDVGTTTTAVARALAARLDLTDMVVFTNGLTIAKELEPAIPRFTVVVTGGTLRPLQHSLVDPLGDTLLERVNASTAFIGCNGIHPQEGVTNVNVPEMTIKRRMVDAAQRCIVVADGSKIGNISLIKVADIDEVDHLVAGRSAPTEVLTELRQLGISVDVAE